LDLQHDSTAYKNKEFKMHNNNINTIRDKNIAVNATASKTIYDLEQAALHHMRSNALEPNEFIADGNIHRYTVDSKRERDEWYVAFNSISSWGLQTLIVVYGSWSAGLKYEFHSWDESHLDKTQVQELTEIRKKAKAEADKKIKEQHNEQAQKAQDIWNKVKKYSTEEHLKYLKYKGINPINVRFGTKRAKKQLDDKSEVFREFPAIIIPIQNIKGEIRSLQYIYYNTDEQKFEKKLLWGAEKKGNFAIIGTATTINDIKPDEEIYITEGYATGNSVHMATDKNVIMAIDCHNISAAIENIRKKFPQLNITIASDAGNGEEQAKEAANKFNCKIATPEFTADIQEYDDKGKPVYKDFNDLHFNRKHREVGDTTSGLVWVKEQLSKAEFVGNTGVSTKKKDSKVKRLEPSPDAIIIVDSKLPENVDQIEQKLIQNRECGIYQRSGMLVEVAHVEPNLDRLIPIIKPLSIIRLVDVATRYIHFEKFKTSTQNKEYLQVSCPEKLAKTLMDRPNSKLPVLKGITNHPILRLDGSLLNKEGYDDATGLLYIKKSEDIFPEIPENPTKADALNSAREICKIFQDGTDNDKDGFPFKNDESKSTVLSAILSSLMVNNIDCIPVHSFSAPQKRSGKTMLADIVSIFATGEENSPIAYTGISEEESKKITALLLEGPRIICWDNVEYPFNINEINMITTGKSIQARILGQSKTVEFKTNALILVTGNNLIIKGDLIVRTLRCELEPEVESPGERKFNIYPPAYIKQNRGVLVMHVLTILKAFIHAGCPDQGIPIWGGFEQYSKIIRGAIVWLGFADPYLTKLEIEKSDEDKVCITKILINWYALFRDLYMDLNDLLAKLRSNPSEEAIALLNNLFQLVSEGRNAPKDIKDMNARILGNALRNKKGQIVGDLKLNSKDMGVKKPVMWCVTKISPNKAPGGLIYNDHNAF
jgi:phage/plasmid primase-like uncharacterized protein